MPAGGDHTITFFAVNERGKAGFDTVSVTSDIISPSVSITTPVPGTQFGAGTPLMLESQQDLMYLGYIDYGLM